MMEYATNIKNAHQLQMMGTTLGARYTLANNIDLSTPLGNTSDVWDTNQYTQTGTGFYPIGAAIGAATTYFTGSFNGNNYTINNLYINLANTAANATSDIDVGLFSSLGATGTVSNVGLTNINVSYSTTVTGISPASRQVGGLVGVNWGGSISNSYTSGSVSVNTISGLAYTSVGGLVGYNLGSITNSYNLANVTKTGSTSIESSVGGLSGNNWNPSGAASISNSYNAGNVTATYSADAVLLVGGLLGRNTLLGGTSSTVTNSYNVGTVTALGSPTNSTNFSVGGLLGANRSGTINTSYSSGVVSATPNYYTGGFIGTVSGGTLTNNYFDTQTSGISGALGAASGGSTTVSGVTPLTTAQSMQSANFTGFTFGATAATAGSATPGGTWLILNGSTRPMLSMEYKTSINNPHQLQLMSFALGANYQLTDNVDMTAGLTNKSDVWATNYITSTGTGFVPVGYNANVASSNFTTTGTEFTGTFNGNGYNINNLYINNPTGMTTFGLFGATAGNITIQNVGLTNVNIFGSNGIGGLIGNMIGGGTSVVSNVFVTGSVTSNVTPSTYFAMGGLIGMAAPFTGGQFTIQNSYSTATVSATGTQTAGGLIGLAQAAWIDFPGNTFSNGTVNIINSYSSGSVSQAGGGSASGFAYLRTGATVTNSFWDVVSSGRTNGYDTSVGAPTIAGLYAGCYAGGGTCATQTITNATLTGSITPKDLSVLATYTTSGPTWSITSTPSTTSTAPSNTWFIFAGNTRPMLMMENKSSITSPHQLQMMGAALGGSYTLANNIDFSTVTSNADVWNSNFNTGTGKGFVPVGSSTGISAFTGSLYGNNYVINKLYINRPATSYIGLFGNNTGNGNTISNLGLTNVNISGGQFTGGLVGENGNATYIGANTVPGTTISNISNVYTTGSIVSNTIAGANPATDWNFAGGLIGYNTSGSLTNSYSTANVSISSTGTGGNAGGLVGNNYANITNSFSTGTVTTTTASQNIGGLIGVHAFGTISQSYSIGNVTTSNGSRVSNG